MEVTIRFIRWGGSGEIYSLTVEPVYYRGNYAVTNVLKKTPDGGVGFDRVYSVTYIPTGQGGDIFFNRKHDAAQFCKWIAAEFPMADQEEIKQRKADIAEMMRRLGGHHIAYRYMFQ